MKRADVKKNNFKKRVAKIYDDYRFVFIATGLILATVVIGIIWSYFDLSDANVFDLNEVLEDKVGEYTAEVHYNDDEEAFVVVEGELEDDELIRLQKASDANLGIKAPIYLVEEGVILDEPVHYKPGLIKRVEWAQWEDGERHEVIDFRILSSVKPDVTAVAEWDIRAEDSYYDEDLYVIEGNIAEYATTVDKLAQMSGLAEMVDDINKENNEAELGDVLMHFMSGSNDLYYHTAYKGIIGESTFYVAQNSTNSEQSNNQNKQNN